MWGGFVWDLNTPFIADSRIVTRVPDKVCASQVSAVSSRRDFSESSRSKARFTVRRDKFFFSYIYASQPPSQKVRVFSHLNLALGEK